MANEARTELNAIDLLMQDHRELESLFSEFDYLQRRGDDTSAVIKSACAELKIHDALENDIFYPAVGEAARDEAVDSLLDDSEDAHDDVLDLMEQLELGHADGASHNARFSAIAKAALEHIEREERELFPLLSKLDRLDLDAVAADMKARTSELMAGGETRQVSAGSI
jgi:hemerythrin superfamily protein